MKTQLQRTQIVQDLQKQILAMQGITKVGRERYNMGLGQIEAAFPEGVFPTGAIHEFVSPERESAAAASGFISCLLSSMNTSTTAGKRNGFCLWISSRRLLFPPALKLLGIDPEYIIFVDLKTDKDVLWAVEEALRCSALVAVIGELRELNFAQSRRLQLTIEESKVTGFIHRIQPLTEGVTACVARWKILPLPGTVEPGMPGVGFPKWNVELTKVRNGRPGSWQMGWTPQGFRDFSETEIPVDIHPNTPRYA